MKIKVVIEAKGGVLSFESEDVNSIIKFINWATSQQAQKTQQAQKPQTTKQTTKQRASENQINKLKQDIENIKAEYGEETLNEIIAQYDLKLENITPKQVNRAYAILRKEFPEYFNQKGKTKNTEEVPF
uniref:Uncharacterized protein n=1 Tax=candidate division WOR-3 bacterium TaxID=2052148 RepID=A0A7V3ZSV6_UNCW3